MRRRIVLPLLVCALSATAAHAQTAPAQGEPAVTPEAMEVARRLFREGVEAAQASRWEDARDRFARTLAIRPAPIIRFNLAVANENLGRFVAAMDLYHQFVRETPAGADPLRVEAAQQRITEFERRIARIRVEVTGDEVRAFRLDGRAQASTLLGVEIPVDPGEHIVEIEGVAGDRQRRVGAFFEGESARVAVELTRTPAIAATGTRDWAGRTQSFGHWVARPGPGGRWIDWAARATVTPPSIWVQRPLTLAIQLGYNAPGGLVAVSARYFPQPWFGVEASVGAPSLFGPSAALVAHARYPWQRFAFGFATGMSASLTRATLSCTSGDNVCRATPSVDGNALGLSAVFAVTGELRLGSRFAVRAMFGARVLANPADLRAMADGQHYSECREAGLSLGNGACPIYTGASQGGASPVAAIDVGYGF
jgi:hypothetical protein